MTIFLSVWSGVGTLAAIVFGYLAYSRGKTKDDQSAGAIMAELGYIKKGIDDTQRKVEKLEASNQDTLQRLIIVEQSVKSAHKRLDDIGAGRAKEN